MWHTNETGSRLGGVGAPGPVSYSTLHTIKRPLVHEVFAKVGSLLALDALLHLTRFGGVGNHADGVVVAHVFPQPVEQHHHLVFHAEDGAQVHHEPQYPGKEALARVFHSF